MKRIIQILIMNFAVLAQAQTINSPLYNPLAPADVDDNLNVNDMAIAVDKGKCLLLLKYMISQMGNIW